MEHEGHLLELGLSYILDGKLRSKLTLFCPEAWAHWALALSPFNVRH